MFAWGKGMSSFPRVFVLSPADWFDKKRGKRKEKKGCLGKSTYNDVI